MVKQLSCYNLQGYTPMVTNFPVQGPQHKAHGDSHQSSDIVVLRGPPVGYGELPQQGLHTVKVRSQNAAWPAQHGTAWKAWLSMAQHGTAWLSMVQNEKAGLSMAQHSTAWHGMAVAWQSMQRPCSTTGSKRPAGKAAPDSLQR